MSSPTWIFDPAPPSGSRDGGNAAEYSFEGQIGTLVREAVQNSLDARAEGETLVDCRFRVCELSGSHLTRFKAGMAWEQLEDNLSAVPAKRGGRGIQLALRQIEQTGRLRVLVIEDRCTKGLPSPEFRRNDDEPNSFCALVRDTLYSDKTSDDAGGSYGLGKSLLWAFSGIKTVLFSTTYPGESGSNRHRMIGRTSLPFHETPDDGACTGKGWFGVQDPSSDQRCAVSIYDEDAQAHAADCMCARDQRDHGLSIVIVGLSEPGEDAKTLEEIADSIQEAALRSFWPALSRSQLSVSVTVEENDQVTKTLRAEPANDPGYAVAATLLHKFDQGELQEGATLTKGQSGMRWVEHAIPKRVTEATHGKLTGKCAVLVRVLDDDEVGGPLDEQIVRFRKPGMIVGTRRRRGLVLNAKPYIAVVLAGLATDAPHAEQAEWFLRSAEPPEHESWTHKTRAIGENYATGSKKALGDLTNVIEKAVKELIGHREPTGGRAPQRLLNKLPFGSKEGGVQDQFMSLLNSKIEGPDASGAWDFAVTCKRRQPDAKPWQVKVVLKNQSDGTAERGVRIASLSATEESVAEFNGGSGLIKVSAGVDKIRLRGTTDPASGAIMAARAPLQIDVTGKLTESQEA